MEFCHDDMNGCIVQVYFLGEAAIMYYVTIKAAAVYFVHCGRL